MRAAFIAAPLVGLSLLGGCAQQPQYLLSERTDAAPLATTSDLRDVPARYTQHAPSTATAKVVKLRIDSKFTDDEQAKIFSAVREWNYALNGAVRFDVVSDLSVVNWTIIPTREGLLPVEWQTPQPLVAHMQYGNGGVIVVYVSRLMDPAIQGLGASKHDLRGLMVHELGAALGGGNGTTLITAHIQDCIGKDMVTSVGAIHNLPTAHLNWCEADATIAAR